MSDAKTHLDGLTQLHQLRDPDARVSIWRQSVADLAAETADARPVPLEGLDPTALCASLRVALGQGLIDDLGWLSPQHAAAALYELAAAIPVGEERRELGRRVLVRLHEGNAETFVTLAAQLAMGSPRGLSGPGIRARATLALQLPAGTTERADALALSLVSKPELARIWLTTPSTGSLPSRRLAARLLERAAREALRRSSQLGDAVFAVFEQPHVLAAWNRLLADRESLVWRHVAVARGLLSRAVPHYADRIYDDLGADKSSTEWRRAAGALAASIAVDPDDGLSRCLSLLRGSVFDRDPGIAGAMILGLSCTAGAEPDATETLLSAIVQISNLDAIEALVELRHEMVGVPVGEALVFAARARLQQAHFAQSDDDGRVALLEALATELSPSNASASRSLRERLASALIAFSERDARAAYALAIETLQAVNATLTELEAASDSTAEGRQTASRAVRQLDLALLETSALPDLLMLGSSAGDAASLQTVQQQFERLAAWLLRQERDVIAPGAKVEHVTLRARRLRALLHLVDADGAFGEDKSPALRERRLRTTTALLARTRADAASPLRRVICAATARACDALLREEVAELSDILIAVALHVQAPEDAATIAEASMDPAAEAVFRAYAQIVQQTAKATAHTAYRARVGLDGLGSLVRALPPLASPRVEALRSALLAFADAVQAALAAQSLLDLAPDESERASRIAAFADAVSMLTRLVAGARRRLGDRSAADSGAAGAALRAVDVALARAAQDNGESMQAAAASAVLVVQQVLPPLLANLAADALKHVIKLPVVAAPDAAVLSVPRTYRESPLPAWLPPNRTLGGFFVLRPLGTGAAGSVFAACRADSKALRHPKRFALKVPEFGGDAARTLSEAEFLRLFREEAGALLAVPEHPNLARLVTFDAGARPKPILVMELVEGSTLQRFIDTGSLDTTRAIDILDGVAAGLEAMHSVGVGHLDLKPSNVVLRDTEQMSPPSSSDLASVAALERRTCIPVGPEGIPVLVDFGLAGRNLRPGCATACYGAPEVWGHGPVGYDPTPMDADVYAFGCLVYEVLTSCELFDGPTAMSIVGKHLRHDGDVPPLPLMATDPFLAPVAAIVRSAVRKDPRQRASLSMIRAALALAAPALRTLPWPLTPGRVRSHAGGNVSAPLPLTRRRS